MNDMSSICNRHGILPIEHPYRDADDHGIFPTDRASLRDAEGHGKSKRMRMFLGFFLPAWQSTDRASLPGCGWSWEFQTDADDHGNSKRNAASRREALSVGNGVIRYLASRRDALSVTWSNLPKSIYCSMITF